MGFFHFFVRLLQSQAIPIAKSIFKAYKHTTKGSNSKARYTVDQFWKNIMAKNNITPPPLDHSTALRILEIEENKTGNLEARQVLDRYYTLFKKNEPKLGGSVYLQSKVFQAKERVMERFPNAVEQQMKFYKEVVEPQAKKEEQEKQEEEKKN